MGIAGLSVYAYGMTPDEYCALSDVQRLDILENPEHPDHASYLEYSDSGLDPNGPSEGAPYGWMTDPDTGERRAKKRPGRQRRAPEPEPATAELVSPAPEPETDRTPIERTEDRAPAGPRRGRGKRRGSASADVPRETEPATMAPFRAGPIAKGMNKLYRKAGKLVSVVNPTVGQALIEITRKDDEDDTTVGEAWEELARTNPRVRAFLLKLMGGAGWSQLFMCHLPVLLAVAVQTGLIERLGFGGLISLMSDDEEPAGSDDPVAAMAAAMGIDPEDMMAMASQLAGSLPQMGTVPPPFSRGV